MLEKIFSLLWVLVLVVFLVAAIWFSAFLLIFIFGAALIFSAGMYLWAWLVRKQIINPRPGENPGTPNNTTVIETSYTRITERNDDA